MAPLSFPPRITVPSIITERSFKKVNMVFSYSFLIFITPYFFSAGYDYYGTETLYSGIDGHMMKAHIFTGVVYYQRLRHMVSDKFQV